MTKKVFQISFKDNEREDRLYNAVVNSYNKSAFVKECIEFYLNNKHKEIKDPVINEELIISEGPVVDKKKEEERETSNIDWDF